MAELRATLMREVETLEALLDQVPPADLLEEDKEKLESLRSRITAVLRQAGRRLRDWNF